MDWGLVFQTSGPSQVGLAFHSVYWLLSVCSPCLCSPFTFLRKHLPRFLGSLLSESHCPQGRNQGSHLVSLPEGLGAGSSSLWLPQAVPPSSMAQISGVWPCPLPLSSLLSRSQLTSYS